MATWEEIRNHLDLDEIEEYRFRDGRKTKNKNKYIRFDDYYVVRMYGNKYFVVDNVKSVRKLLRLHTWGNSHGYAYNSCIHNYIYQKLLNYDDGCIADHINRCRWDNRSENLRITTQMLNMRNRTIAKNNTSDKQGVSRYVDKRHGLHYWRSLIIDNNRKRLEKKFSIKNLGETEAKRQAVAKRIEWEQQFGYCGE
jgi:hypothetical protein